MQPPRRRSGFSLIEVMIAATLLSVGLTVIVATFDAGRSIATRDRHMTQAIHVAESVAESLLVLEQSDDDLDAGAHSTARRFDKVGQEVAPTDTTNGIYAATWDVAANTPIENIRRVTVSVAWNVAGSSGTTKLTVHRR